MLWGFPRASGPPPRQGWGVAARVGNARTPASPRRPPPHGQGTGAALLRLQGGGEGGNSRAHAAARSPSSEEVSPGYGRVQLKPVSHEPPGSGNRGVGGGVHSGRGPPRSTYMRRGPADGCQEFPMRGDGGKFGQLGLANEEPREGSAPTPAPARLCSRSASVSASLSVRGD